MIDQVVILAGGQATRLYPLSLYRPKVFLPVCNETLLAGLLRQLQVAGIHRAVVTLPAGTRNIDERTRAATPEGFDLTPMESSGTFRGQVPAVRELLEPGTRAVLVIYGDSVLSIDFAGLLARHEQARTAGGLATIAYHRPSDLRIAEKEGRTYHGVLSVDEQGRLTRFVEKPLVDAIQDGFDLANAAAFVCERALLEMLHFRSAKDFSYDVFQPAVSELRLALFGFDMGAGWRYDLGSIDRFYEVNRMRLCGQLAGKLPGRQQQAGVWIGDGTDCDGVHFEPPVLLGAGVQVGAGARLGPNVVIGDRCRIAADAWLRDCTLLEQCDIGKGAKLDRCLLGGRVRVQAGMELRPHTVLGDFSVVQADGWPNWAEVL